MSVDHKCAGGVTLSWGVKYCGAYVQGHLGCAFRKDLNWCKIVLLSEGPFVAIRSCLLHFSAAEVMQQPVISINWSTSKSGLFCRFKFLPSQAGLTRGRKKDLLLLWWLFGDVSLLLCCVFINIFEVLKKGARRHLSALFAAGISVSSPSPSAQGRSGRTGGVGSPRPRARRRRQMCIPGRSARGRRGRCPLPPVEWQSDGFSRGEPHGNLAPSCGSSTRTARAIQPTAEHRQTYLWLSPESWCVTAVSPLLRVWQVQSQDRKL